MDEARAARATAATLAVAQDQGLKAESAVLLQNSNKLGLRLWPCDTFARVAPIGEEVAAFELLVASALADDGAPVAALDPRIDPAVHLEDGFAITFWTHYESLPEPLSPTRYGASLQRLHRSMKKLTLSAPHFTDRVAQAQRLVADPALSPDLATEDRRLLLDTLDEASSVVVRRRGHLDQLLHGEPHSGNVLNTASGACYVDFETCCRGPVEFDLAHAPIAVGDHYPGADPVALDESRRLILAMVAAWRWDADDEFPFGRQHGLAILQLLRDGAPWPSLDLLTVD